MNYTYSVNTANKLEWNQAWLFKKGFDATAC